MITEPKGLWTAWSFEPGVVTLLCVATVFYFTGVRRLRNRLGHRYGRTRRTLYFTGGLLTLVVALLSPISAMASSLFFVHMIQHLLLVIVAAPLIVLGEPLYVAIWALPLDARHPLGRLWRESRGLRRAWRALSRPPVAWFAHIATLWIWHVPRLYDWALREEGIHVLEHATFLVTALLFWWVVLDRHRLSVGGAVFYLFAAALQCTLLGAFLTLARHPWYVGHSGTTSLWGFTPLEDQQLAGLIMWIPAGLAYLWAMLSRVGPVLRVVPDLQERGAGRAKSPS